MMRIAIVAPLVTRIREPQLGGSQAVVADLATGLQNRGHEVHVYAASGSAIPGVTVVDSGIDAAPLAGLRYRHGRSPAIDARAADLAFATVYASIRRGSYDVVHNHAFDPPAMRLASSLSSPVVHTLHLPPDPAMAAALTEARRSENPPTIAAVSASHAAAWRAVAPVDVILPDGVPVDRIPWSATGGTGAIFAGRFSPEKGAEDAIAIAREASVRIDLYGEPYDPDYAQLHVMSHQGDAGVSIHGGLMRSELWRRMADACAVICPAKWDEPFGMVAAEAQAAGTPVIAYRRGALPEIIIDGRTGFLVPSDDVGAAARSLMAVSRIRREDCRQHAVADLSLDASLAAHERLYETLQAPAKANRRA
jgi:glycosyltransferase involved in cell wall biosynthesis